MGRTFAMSKYQITLTPVDKFFFGGDMTFSVGDDKRFNEQFSSYIIQSSLFPQQTSLLGMLRFLILRNHPECFDGDKINQEKAGKLIGPRSFSVSPGHTENVFGSINNLSHIRVRRKIGSQCIDLDFAPLFDAIDLGGAAEGIYNDNYFCIPPILKKTYNAKDGLYAYLTDGVKKYRLDEIFVKDRRVGIDRNIETGKVEEAALYKQISYRFNNRRTQYCFVFEADVADSLKLEEYNGQMVSVGGDNSQFIIGISNVVLLNPDINSVENAVYLLSPTFLTREDVSKASFAVTRLLPFRFLESGIMTDPKSYNILNRKLKRSEKKYELYDAGSIFYFNQENARQDFISAINNKQDFKQIGYNEYK